MVLQGRVSAVGQPFGMGQLRHDSGGVAFCCVLQANLSSQTQADNASWGQYAGVAADEQSIEIART